MNSAATQFNEVIFELAQIESIQAEFGKPLSSKQSDAALYHQAKEIFKNVKKKIVEVSFSLKIYLPTHETRQFRQAEKKVKELDAWFKQHAHEMVPISHTTTSTCTAAIKGHMERSRSQGIPLMNVEEESALLQQQLQKKDPAGTRTQHTTTALLDMSPLDSFGTLSTGPSPTPRRDTTKSSKKPTLMCKKARTSSTSSVKKPIVFVKTPFAKANQLPTETSTNHRPPRSSVYKETIRREPEVVAASKASATDVPTATNMQPTEQHDAPSINALTQVRGRLDNYRFSELTIRLIGDNELEPLNKYPPGFWENMFTDPRMRGFLDDFVW